MNLRILIARVFLKRFRYGLVPQSALREFLQDLLLNPPESSTIFLFSPNHDESVGFSRAKDSGFYMNFPSLKRSYYQRAITVLNDQGIPCVYYTSTFRKMRKTSLHIDAAQNVEMAFKILTLVLDECFTIRSRSSVELYYTVDSPQLRKFKGVKFAA